MRDPRQTPSNGYVAHTSLQGQVTAKRFVNGTSRIVGYQVTAILDRPNGARLRELLPGALFRVLSTQDGYSFGFAERDGYVGYVAQDSLAPEGQNTLATHQITAFITHLRQHLDLHVTGEEQMVPMGSTVRVIDHIEKWALLAPTSKHDCLKTFVPKAHLTPIGKVESDPVSVAERMIGTPYLWGGNSTFGIDCSGLIQFSCHMCGIACPGDSDQQEATLGQIMQEGTDFRRGDLLFWAGHVAWVVDQKKLIHANANSMSVAYEDIDQALQRIEMEKGGKLRAHKRRQQPS